MFFIILVCLVNLFISFQNAKTCGQVWCESSAIGGLFRVLVWCGVIQSAIGFTMVYMVLAVFLLSLFGKVDEQDIRYLSSLVYIMIIVPALGTGLIIMFQSWIIFFREKSMRNFTNAAWNTFANGYNTYRAFNSFGPALDNVIDLFGGLKSKDRKNNANIILLAIILLLLGAATTYTIVTRYAGTLEIPEGYKGAIES